MTTNDLKNSFFLIFNLPTSFLKWFQGHGRIDSLWIGWNKLCILIKSSWVYFFFNGTKCLVEDQRPLLRLLYSKSGKNSHRHTSGPSSVKTNHIIYVGRSMFATRRSILNWVFLTVLQHIKRSKGRHEIKNSHLQPSVGITTSATRISKQDPRDQDNYKEKRKWKERNEKTTVLFNWKYWRRCVCTAEGRGGGVRGGGGWVIVIGVCSILSQNIAGHLFSAYVSHHP